MKQTPSALKWLAEKRARLANDLKQTRKIALELTEKAQVLEADLAALDRSLRLYDGRIEPANIEPVNGWQGNYGKRGALRAAVVEVLKEFAPEWMTTTNISLLICAKFGLDFSTAADRKHWYTGSFRGTLKRLEVERLVEHECNPEPDGSEVARWRWKDAGTQTLSALTRSVTKATGARATARP
jgi:hypothetical protein